MTCDKARHDAYGPDMMLTGQAASRMVSVRDGLLVNFSVSKMLYEGLSKLGSAGTNRHHPAMQQSPLTWKHERQWLPQCNKIRSVLMTHWGSNVCGTATLANVNGRQRCTLGGALSRGRRKATCKRATLVGAACCDRVHGC